jgi:glycerol-3-phosphate acyltransferase PlsX
MTLKIGIDLMGNDHSPKELLEALQKIPLEHGIELIAIGTPDLAHASPFFFHSAPDFIKMEDHPITAIRKKRDASMLLGLRLLKKKKIDAFVTAGNTGALVLGSKIILSTLPQIARPAFLALIPTKKQPTAVLDLGANVECKASHLVEFALMASAYLETKGIKNPRIGLLNIGEEPLKGTSELRLAYQALQRYPNPPFRFAGNIEGKSVFDGDVDALITDGFTGNVFLKTAEGIASLMTEQISQTLAQAHLPQTMSDLHKQMQYAEHAGALLIGLRGIVIKCHGYSSTKAFINAVLGAIKLSKTHFMDTFQESLHQYLKTPKFI